uniref:Uncharacterized protein n=1 Tax=Sphenodon punctatus TaxID=8508 RepID=A0A8D0H3H7_SPHPU
MGGYHEMQCYACCPPSTVTIRPPPFVLNIPGPALYCPSQPFGIEQHNPCATRYGGGALVDAFTYDDESGSSLSNFYDREALPSSTFGYRSRYWN